MNYAIAHDLSRKLQQSLGEVLERELRIAQHACGLPELALMVIEASRIAYGLAISQAGG